MKRALVSLLLATLAFMLHPAPVEAQSWLNPWAERVPITINNTGAELTNYQVEVKLDSSFRFTIAQPDGSDVRVTTADGITPLPFWIQDWDSVAKKATIYIKAPAFSPGTSQVYLYYGNAGAASISDAASVFDFYDGFEAPFTSSNAPLSNASTYQVTPTYDGSGQVVHPGIVYFPSGWNGWKYWLVVTPYPGSDATKENPSILVSNDGASWQVPPGLTNPVAIRPGEPNLADGELFYDDVSNSLWLYYNQDYVAPGTHGYLRVSDTTGVVWGPEQTILQVSQSDLLSQAVLKVSSSPTTYGMWYVNAGSCSGQANAVEYRTSADGVNWSDPTTLTTFSIPGYVVWHPEVIYVPSKGEYWALVAAYPSGSSCSHPSLFFAKSSDGINWTTFATPALTPSSDGWDDGNIYRSTLLYDQATDMLRVWYSSQGSNGQWHLGYTERKYTDFLAALASSAQTWTTSGSGSWTQSTSQIKRDSYSTELVQDAGEDYVATHPQPGGTDFYQEWDMYDDMSTSAFKVVRVSSGSNKVGIGVFTGCSPDKYCFHNSAYNYTASAARAPGWHKFGIRLGSDSSATFFVDGVQVGLLTGQFNYAGQIAVEGFAPLPTTYYVDDVRIRKSATTEPNVAVGGAENENQAKPPVAHNDSYSARAGSSLTIGAPGVLINDTDPQQYSLSSTALFAPTHGTLQLNSDGAFIYTPNQGFTGVDSFTYAANNGSLNSNAAIVTIAVSGWIDQNWSDRRSVSISNPCGGTCTNYQVHIGLDSSFDFSKPLADGSDLRLTASDGVTLIPFWIENWDPVGKQASIWAKVPTIPPSGTTIYLYYGDAVPTAPPGPTVVNLPPVGPWTFPPNNLIVPIGDPGSGSQLIAENIVYDDPATGGDGKYWLVFASYRDNSIALAWSTTPASPSSWHWNSLNPVVTTANAPFLIKDGSTWYIFFADRSHGTGGQLDMRIATASSPGGPYTRVPADTSITGTSVTLTTGSTAMLGVGTSFITQLAVGQFAKMANDATSAWIQICSIASPTSATLCNAYTGPGGTGAAQFNAGGIVLWPTMAWESWRVDEPFVMKMPDDTYMLMYMADSGGNIEQVGYATAPAIQGPYTKYTGNPAIPFGVAGSYDHGTVADPWIYPVGNTYYIGYAASPTSSSPWHAGLATTTDFKTFNRESVTLTSPDGGNSFRGGVTLVGNTLVYAYGADGYDSRIATQPATATVGSIINNPRAVFDFYDDFGGSSLDPTNWAISTKGTGGTATFNAGVLTLTAQSTVGTSGIIELLGPATIGKSSILEVRGRHLDAGLNPGAQSNTAFEVGFATADTNNLIRLMDFPDLTNYTVQAMKLGTGPYVSSATSFDKSGYWHTYQIYRDSTTNALFSVDGNLLSTLGANLADWKLPPMLMSYANNPAPQSRFDVDWVRVRQACATDPTVAIGSEETPSGDHTPTAYAQIVSTPHDVPVDFTLTATDPDGDPLTYNITSGPAHGTLSGSAPNLTYTPSPNYHGNDAFVFKAFDGQGYSNPVTVAITVTYVNHAPTASSQAVTMNQDSSTPITLSATDPDSDPLTYTVVSGPFHGAMSGAAPNLTYTPNALYYGPDGFLFKANDGLLDSDVATVSITVNHLNHAPVAVGDIYSAVSGKQLSVLYPGVLGNDIDVDGDTLMAVLVSGPAHGSLVLYPNGSFGYAANAGYTGNDTFSYKANDGFADSNVTTVSISVSGWFDVNWVNRRSVALPNVCSTTCSNLQVQIKLNSTNFNFARANADGSDLRVTDSDATTVLPFWIENWNAGTQTASIWVKVPSIPTTGTTLYLYYGNPSPPARTNDPNLVFDFYDGFDGTAVDTTKWTTNIAGAGSITVSNSIVVLNSTNNYTQLLCKSSFASGNIVEVYGVHENQGATPASVLAVGWRIGTSDWNNNTRLMDYTGDAGNDETKYHASSAAGNATNLFSGYKNSTTAADRNWHTFGVYRSTAGTADFRVDGNSVITPLIGSPYVLTTAMPLWIGTYASGTTSKLDVDWVRLRKFYGSDPVATVGTEESRATNHAPTAVDDAYSIPPDNTLSVSSPGVLANDTDPDGDLLMSTLVSNPSHGIVTLNPTGSFVYVPATGFNGSDSFSYKANDGLLDSAVTTVILTITATTQDQTIAFGPLANKTYGDSPFTVTAAATSGLAVTFTAGATDNCTISGATVAITGAGGCMVTAHQAGNRYYNAAPDVMQSFTIAKATAPIALTSLNQIYDDTAKSAAATTTPSGLTVNITYDGASTAPTAAGSYAVVGTISDSNYQGTASGTLTIAKATASVTPNAASKTYSGVDPAFTGTLSGFVAADNVTAIFSRTPGETVAGGPYIISATLNPASVLGNYNITYNTAAFTIVPAVLVVTAQNASSVFGQPISGLGYSLSGFVLGDTPTVVSGTAVLSTEANPMSAPGTYAITVSQGTLAAANYGFNFAAGVLTIQQATSTTGLVAGNSSLTPTDSTTLTATVTVPGAVGIPAGLTRKCNVVVDPTKISNTVTGFPMLISEAMLIPNCSEIFSQAANGGGDLRISSDINGGMPLPLEVVTFNTGTTKAELYTKVPSLNSMTGGSVWIWYGNPGLSQPAADSPYGSQAVWDANYRYVSHNNSAPPVDSTSNHLTGTAVSSPAIVPGAVGNGISMNGSTQFVTVGASADLRTSGPWTMESIGKPTGSITNLGWLFSKTLATDTGYGCGLSQGKWQCFTDTDNGVPYDAQITSTTVPSASRFDYIDWTYTGIPTPYIPMAPALITHAPGLPFGGKMWTFGGHTGNPATPIGNTYIYDPEKNSWSTCVSLPTARWGAAAVNVGTVAYVLSGNIDTTTASAAMDAYDTSNGCTGSWVPKAAIPAAIQGQGITAAYVNNHIYAFHGCAHVYSYDPADDAGGWTMMNGCSADSGTWASTVTDGTYIYLLGGSLIGTRMMRFDPAGNSWSNVATLPYTSWASVAQYNAGGIYYIMGRAAFSGVSMQRSAYLYNVAAGTFTHLPDDTCEGDAYASAIISGKLIVAGKRSLNIAQVLTDGYYSRLDTTTNTWDTTCPVSHLYINGALETNGISQLPHTTSQLFTLGAQASGVAEFPGIVDETRISTIDRGPDYAATTNNNLMSPGTFATAHAPVPGGTVSFLAGGSVRFLLGATMLGTSPLTGVDTNNAMATLALNGSQLAAGGNTLTAVYTGDANYAGSTSAPITVNLVTMQSQTITFGPMSNVTYGVAPYTLSAMASSGLPVSFRVVSGPASITGNTITVLGAGLVTVEADQVGDPTYAAAPPVQQSLTVAAAILTVTANNAGMSYRGTLPDLTATISGFVNGDSQATATSGSPAVSTGGGADSPVGTYGITASVGTLTAANYTFSFVNGTLTINQAMASVTPNVASKVYGTADPALSGTLSGFLAADNVTATYSRSAGETVSGSPYTISATLSPSGMLGNYNITYNTAAFAITKAEPSIVWSNPADVGEGTALSATQLNASSPVPGTFTYTPPAGTVLSLGSHTLTAVFHPTDSSNYVDGKTATVTVNVISATATMSSPANGSSLSGSTVSFIWTAGGSATDYWLELGSTLGGKQYFSRETTGTTLTVSNLPLDGSTVYATLYSLAGGTWKSNRYTYTAYNFVKAVISSPAAGSVLAGRTVTFSWNNTGATEYWLELGTTPGGKQLYSTSAGTGTSLTAKNLPLDGKPLYATLYTRTAAVPWQTTTAAYTAGVVGMIATPANGSTLSGSTVSFNWSPGTNATDYWLEIGSTLGGKQLYSRELGNVTTATVNNLPLNGSALYVTLYSQMAGVWEKSQTSYTALNFAKATLSGAIPANGTMLLGTTVTFSWNPGTGASDYWMELGSTLGGKQYYSAPAAGGVTSLPVKNLPVDGSAVYATLYSRPSGGTWQTDQVMYTAASKAVITTPLNGSTLSGTTVTFSWTPGSGPTDYWLELGTTPGGKQLYSRETSGTSLTVSNLPKDGSTVYATLYCLISGTWQKSQYSYLTAP